MQAEAVADTETMMRHQKGWEDWYRLARFTLACRHEEAVQYANLRFVEEQNRASLQLLKPDRHRPANN